MLAGLAAAAILAAQPASNLSAASVDDRSFVLDKNDVTRDHRELAEFRRLLAALDDALRKSAVERYESLNRRLHLVMERELEQAREKTKRLESARRQTMRADLGNNPYDALEPLGPESVGRSRRVAEARRRAERMRRILLSVSELEYGLQSGDPNYYSRNAAMLDQFLKVMREDLADLEKDAGGAESEE